MFTATRHCFMPTPYLQTASRTFNIDLYYYVKGEKDNLKPEKKSYCIPKKTADLTAASKVTIPLAAEPQRLEAASSTVCTCRARLVHMGSSRLYRSSF